MDNLDIQIIVIYIFDKYDNCVYIYIYIYIFDK